MAITTVRRLDNEDKTVIAVELTNTELFEWLEKGEGFMFEEICKAISKRYIEEFSEEIMKSIDLDSVVKHVENYIKLEFAKKKLQLLEDKKETDD